MIKSLKLVADHWWTKFKREVDTQKEVIKLVAKVSAPCVWPKKESFSLAFRIVIQSHINNYYFNCYNYDQNNDDLIIINLHPTSFWPDSVLRLQVGTTRQAFKHVTLRDRPQHTSFFFFFFFYSLSFFNFLILN